MIKLGLSQRDFPPTWKPHKWLSARHTYWLPTWKSQKGSHRSQNILWTTKLFLGPGHPLSSPTHHQHPHTALGRFPNSRVTYPTQSPSVKCPGLLRGLWFLPQTCQSFPISLQNCHLTGDISASLDRQHPYCFRRGKGWISHCPRS